MDANLSVKHDTSIFRTEEFIFKMEVLHLLDTLAPMHKTKARHIPQ
jgi:hypothetical protein